ncbi:MAG: hypothetical protein GY866_00780, partial [Proteobacteria bacterium]|nr:hypothetical protein [Pseudomonadota bacterium]
MPLIVEGAEQALSGIQTGGDGEKTSIVEVIVSSVVSSLKGRDGYLNEDSKQGSLTARQTVLHVVSRASLGSLDEAGISATGLAASNKRIVASMVGNLDEAGLTADDLKGAVSALVSGAGVAQNDISMTGFTSDNLDEILKEIAAGAVGALGDIEVEGYGPEDLGEMINGIASSATGVLDDIEMEGYDSDDLGEMLNAISSGATSALDEIDMAGYDYSRISEFATEIKAGVIDELDTIEMEGYEYDASDTTYTDIISSSVEDELEDLDEYEYQAPGFAVSSISGNTTESGGTATFTVKLNSMPAAEVTIGVSSSDSTEGVVSPAGLTFTPENWNAANHVVTVTGVDDDLDDGNQVYSILLAAASSSDGNYRTLVPPEVSVSNTDNDTAGFTVGVISGSTTEAGGTATFWVHLNSQPTADVTLALSSSDMGEGSIDKSSLTFTAINWNAGQIVTVTGANDDLEDGDQDYTIILSAAVSGDGDYDGLTSSDVSIVNTDMGETAGFVVGSIGGDTGEDGTSAFFTVKLTSEPTSNVTIIVSSNDAGEGTVDKSSLTFTAANWNAEQKVTVTGADDDIQDGNQTYTIVLAAASSSDSRYDNLKPSDVWVTNTDNNSTGFTIRAISGNTGEDGTQAAFTVKLTSKPIADVTIGVSSSDTGEGTIDKSSLTFTTDNWNAEQTVTVAGVDDEIEDGNQTYTIVLAAAVSSDSNYDNLKPSDVLVANTDNDSAGFIVGAIDGYIGEDGTQASFSVKLTSEPTSSVTVDVSSSDESEGTVDKSSLTFTAANWNANQTVTVTGTDDNIQDGNQTYTIVLAAASSSDSKYDNLKPSDVSVTNMDNDSAGFAVGVVNGNTGEDGAQATFTVKLTVEPTSGVTIDISSSDAGEGTVDKSNLTFTADNWDANQTVTVTGADDDIQDGNQTYTIVLAAAVSSDSNYDTLKPSDVLVVNTDMGETAGFLVGNISNNTGEDGTQATFTVKLTSEPTSNVAIDVSSSDTGEGTVDKSSLTFTSDNFNANQTVTVVGVDDDIQDGNQTYSIVLAAASSSDSNYDSLDPSDVLASNTDMGETAGFIVSDISSNTAEDGTWATFSVRLTSEPASNVTIDISSSDTGEGTVDTSNLIFTSSNWDTEQIVNVTGVDDDIQDGNRNYTIVLAAAGSGDGNYDGAKPSDVSVVNTDMGET